MSSFAINLLAFLCTFLHISFSQCTLDKQGFPMFFSEANYNCHAHSFTLEQTYGLSFLTGTCTKTDNSDAYGFLIRFRSDGKVNFMRKYADFTNAFKCIYSLGSDSEVYCLTASANKVFFV